MKLDKTVTVAFRALFRNPTRAVLTTLGIVIGIAAVIAMMEIGKGSSTSIKRSIEKMGANTVLVMPGWSRQIGVNMGGGSAMSLTPDDAAAIARECVNVSGTAPIVLARSMQLIFGSVNWTPAQFIGTSPDYFTIRNFNLAEGRAFTAREVESQARVCVVGQTIVREVFGGLSPIDAEVRIKDVNFRVIGVLEGKGANMMGSDEDDIVLAPWTTIRMRITGLRTGSPAYTSSSPANSPSSLYPGSGVALFPEQDSNFRSDTMMMPRFTHLDQILVGAVAPNKVKAAIEELTLLLRERHRIKPNFTDDFWIRNSTEFMKTLSGTSTIMTNLLLIVALISLVVGGVGIMNIMLVSVTERTREIGLRMAVGARSIDILQQFLIESMVLCLVGGIIGILLGHGAALAVEYFQGWPVESSPGTVLAAVLVSAGVGIVFGFYPAWKASKLDPIEALRYE